MRDQPTTEEQVLVVRVLGGGGGRSNYDSSAYSRNSTIVKCWTQFCMTSLTRLRFFLPEKKANRKLFSDDIEKGKKSETHEQFRIRKIRGKTNILKHNFDAFIQIRHRQVQYHKTPVWTPSIARWPEEFNWFSNQAPRLWDSRSEKFGQLFDEPSFYERHGMWSTLAQPVVLTLQAPTATAS